MLVFCMPDSASQLVIGMIISAMAIAVYSEIKPYRSEANDELARYAQWAVFLTLFASLLIKAEIPDEDGYQTNLFGGAMVAVNLAILVLGVLQVNTERHDIAGELVAPTRAVERAEQPELQERRANPSAAEAAGAPAPAPKGPRMTMTSPNLATFGSLVPGGGAPPNRGGTGGSLEGRPASGTREDHTEGSTAVDRSERDFLENLEDRMRFLDEQLADDTETKANKKVTATSGGPH